MKNDPVFADLRKIVVKRQKQSCEMGQTPGIHAADIIQAPALAIGWAQGKLGLDNPCALLGSVLINFQSSFMTRGRQELHTILNKDIVEGTDR